MIQDVDWHNVIHTIYGLCWGSPGHREIRCAPRRSLGILETKPAAFILSSSGMRANRSEHG